MSVWTYKLTDGAKRTLCKLDKPTQARIVAAIERLAGTSQGDVKKMRGTLSEWRLRVGDYRVIFERQGDRLVILVLQVGNRRDVYAVT